MRNRFAQLPEGEVAVPPPEWFRAGIYLGMDASARFLTDGMPLRRGDWWHDAIVGGGRVVNDVDVTEATAIIIGAPGVGHKSAGWMAGVIAQWGGRGPVIDISTKPDQALWTGPLRERLGTVTVLDWSGKQAAALPYRRVKWSPLDGCEDAGIAKDRITSMMETALMGGAKGDPFWQKNGVAVVTAYAHAAAVKGAGVEQVMAWLDRDELAEPQRVLKSHGSRARFGSRLATLGGKAEETREGVLAMARLVFEACEDPAVLDGCTPDLIEPAFDIDAFLDSSDTLYILDKGGKSTVSVLAPLTVALINAIWEKAEAKADAAPGGQGRLKGRGRPVLFIIDETAAISPLPNLVQLLAQARGRGITACLAVQSFSQLTERWGQPGAAAILDTCAYRLISAGLQDMDFLTDISKSLGEKQVWRPSLGSQSAGSGSGASRKGKSESHTLVETPNYKASALSALPAGKAMLLGREGARPVQLPALPPLLETMERAEELANKRAEANLQTALAAPRVVPSRWARLRGML